MQRMNWHLPSLCWIPKQIIQARREYVQIYSLHMRRRDKTSLSEAANRAAPEMNCSSQKRAEETDRNSAETEHKN